VARLFGEGKREKEVLHNAEGNNGHPKEREELDSVKKRGWTITEGIGERNTTR